MAKVIRKKAKHNAKITVIFCVYCGDAVKMDRNSHSKYCKDSCKTQESLYRKRKGFTFLLFKGTEDELAEFYLKPDRFLVSSPLRNDLFEINRGKETLEPNNSWKLEFNDFILYYFSNIESAPYEIYCTEAKYKKWQSFETNSKRLDESLKSLGTFISTGKLLEIKASQFKRVIEDEDGNE